MKRFCMVCIALAFAFGARGADRPDYLIRIQRQTETDLVRLLDAGIPVVHETSQSLFAEMRQDELAALDELGFRHENLDKDPWAWDYYTVGLRPDSDSGLLYREGVTLFQEENWVLWRVPRGEKMAWIGEAKVFLSLLPHEVRKRPTGDLVTPAAQLRPPGPMNAVPLVQQMVNSVNTTDVDSYWTALVGTSGTWLTRYSTNAGCTSAANYVLSEFQNMGLQAQNITHTAGHAPNTEGEITGALNPGVIYLVSGHLDDTPSSGNAPGADDNASGCVNVLEAAKVLSCYAFKNTVRFLTVTGEEQGLYGSEAYAAAAAAAGENIQGVINMDMPGWAGDGLPGTGENLDLNYDSNSAALGAFYAQCATDYSTGLPVDAFLCPSLTASDHYPFWQEGYKAVCGITDNEDYCSHAGNYPYYHTINDTLANCGTRTFFYNVVKTTIAALAELGEPFKITLDRASYGCTATVSIIVGDRDLNTNSTTAQTVSIQIWSTRESTPETVTLTEDGVNSMIFRGTITLTGSAPVNGDGLLSVNTGDTLTARYIDAVDCNGSTNVTYTATGTVSADCTPPVISNVQVTALSDTTATITWTTDEAANSRVTYGLATPPGTNKDDPGNYVTSHSVTVTGLTACTKYYFSVTSQDAVGNTATSNNGGSYYSFTTYGRSYIMGPDTVEGGVLSWVVSPTSGTDIWHQDACKAVSGTHSWKCGKSDSPTCTAQYASSLSNYTLTWNANINLGSAGHGYHLRFNEWYDTESNTGCTYDPLRTQISTDGGTNWTTLATNCGASGGWLARDYDLASYTGSTVRIRFYFTSDGSGNGLGWFVDDIEVSKSQSCTADMGYQSNTFTDVCSGTGAGSGNGIIDSGEDITVHPVLKNTGSQGATGITATLSTGTAGITVTNATASYPDLAVGASAACNSPHFTFQVGTGVACGTTINFTLTISAAAGGGPWTQNFTVTVGQLVSGTPTSVFSESFDGTTFPPTGWTTAVVGSSSTPAAWARVTTSTNPTGISPHTGAGMGELNSYHAQSGGSNRLARTANINIPAGSSSASAVLWVYHETAYTTNADRIIVQTSPDGTTWTDRGTVNRYDGSTGWKQHTVDLSAMIGAGNFRVGYLGVSAYGNDTYMDDVSVTYTPAPTCTMDACTPSTCTPPGAPTLNSATGTCSAVNLAWTAGSGTTNAYNVYRSTNTACPVGTLTKLNGTPLSAATLTYSDTTAVAGTSYTYVVRGACNTSGVTESGNSNCLAAARLATPAAPSTVSAVAACGGITVSWTNSPGATSHNVVRGTICGTALDTFTNATSPYNDTTAVAGTAYNYWVVAANGCGDGANSTCATATRPAVPSAPAAPAVADPDSCSATGVTITWGTVSGATGYDLQVDGGAVVAGVASPYTYIPVDANSHSYAVRAKNACGNGSYSGGTSGTDAATGPPSVQPLYLEKIGADLLIRWTPIADTSRVDYYEVMRGLSPTGPFDTQVGSTSGIASGFTMDLSSQPGAAFYKVRAVKGTCVGSLD